jgi:hypothetical protein
LLLPELLGIDIELGNRPIEVLRAGRGVVLVDSVVGEVHPFRIELSGLGLDEAPQVVAAAVLLRTLSLGAGLLLGHGCRNERGRCQQ